MVTMKRATVLNRKGRRTKVGSEKESPSSNNDGVGNEAVHVEPVRRKPTSDEAALTAKNYRLAKELSDLRVRHRDECKKVTRLTMENMNLASRWRDAVSQVAVLKKEVALHKQRAAEAEARQKEIELRSNSNKTGAVTPPPKSSSFSVVEEKSPRGSTLHDVAAEMDRMDRLLAAHSSGAQQSQQQSSQLNPSPVVTDDTDELTKSSSSPPSSMTPDSSSSNNTQQGLRHDSTLSDGVGEENNKSQDQPVTPSPERSVNAPTPEANFEEDFFAVFDGDELMGNLDDDPPLESPEPLSPSESPPPATPEEKGSGFDDEILPMMKTPSSLFPRTASPQIGFTYDEQFPPDITADVTKHPRSVERKVLPDFNDIEEEDGPILASSLQLTGDTLSSIDAFEASFATKFPDSFSPGEAKKSTSSLASTAEEELYNPFFPSPPKENKSFDGAIMIESPRSARNSFDKSPASVGSSDSRRGLSDIPTSPSEGGASQKTSPESLGCRDMAAASSQLATGAACSKHLSPTNKTWTPPPSGSFSPGELTTSSANSGSVKSYHTPRVGHASPEVTRPIVVSDFFPARPEKTGAAAARARYEKALQPRGYVGGARRYFQHEIDHHGSSPAPSPKDSLIAEKLGVDAEKLATAKSRVLERTAIYAGRTPPTPSDENPHNARRTSSTFQDDSPAGSGNSKPWDEVGDIPLGASDGAFPVSSASTRFGVSASSPRQPLGQNRPWGSSGNGLVLANDKADGVLANSSSVSPSNELNGGGRSRRSVKQPLSYAEPSLGTKLRRGDLFFAKVDSESKLNLTAGREEAISGHAQRLQDVSTLSVHEPMLS